MQAGEPRSGIKQAEISAQEWLDLCESVRRVEDAVCGPRGEPAKGMVWKQEKHCERLDSLEKRMADDAGKRRGRFDRIESVVISMLTTGAIAAIWTGMQTMLPK